jgi:hypothetical protein
MRRLDSAQLAAAQDQHPDGPLCPSSGRRSACRCHRPRCNLTQLRGCVTPTFFFGLDHRPDMRGQILQSGLQARAAMVLLQVTGKAVVLVAGSKMAVRAPGTVGMETTGIGAWCPILPTAQGRIRSRASRSRAGRATCRIILASFCQTDTL